MIMKSNFQVSDTSTNSEANEVHRHTIQMSRETACRVPQLKVIRVSDHYPSAAKVYLPSCTRLHQCAEDTGCCGVSQKCGPKSTKRVELYFFVSIQSSELRFFSLKDMSLVEVHRSYFLYPLIEDISPDIEAGLLILATFFIFLLLARGYVRNSPTQSHRVQSRCFKV
jgi:hypothetical protein